MSEAITEAQHQAAILELAQLTGWKVTLKECL